MFFSRFSQKNHYLQIKATNVFCCIDLERIHKILSLMAITPVLDSPSYLAGVFNLYGRIVPVIDLSLRLGCALTEAYTCNTNVIVCRAFENDAFLGLIVSSVGNIIELPHDELQLAPQLSGQKPPFSAFYQQQEHICFVLNTDVLLDSCLSQLYSLSPGEVNQLINKTLSSD